MEDPGKPPDAEELATLQDQLALAQAQIEQSRRDAADAHARAEAAVAEAVALRNELQAADERASSATTEAESLREQLAGTSGTARGAAERYRDLVVRTEPELPAELIVGDSIDAVDASVEAARAMVGRVRSHIEAQAQAGRVPAGAPPRSAPDLSVLTPEQKIRHGLAARTQT